MGACHGPSPKSLLGWIGRILFGQFFLSLFLVSLVGIIWATATPQWIKPVAERAAYRMALLLSLPLLALAALYLFG